MATAKILVVDDDNAMREMMSLALSKEGYSVQAADSSDAAMKAVASDSFDLIITDIYLGDGTGIEVLEHCSRHCPAAKVILVTAHGTVETATSARRLGVFDYLAKPFQVETLVERVGAALRNSTCAKPRIAMGPEARIFGTDPAIVDG